jgi:hypothetical protein
VYRIYIILRYRTLDHRFPDMEVKHEKGGCWSEVGLALDSPTTTKLTEHCREMQLFLAGYFVIEICEIFTVGGFPLDGGVRRVSTPSIATGPFN